MKKNFRLLAFIVMSLSLFLATSCVQKQQPQVSVQQNAVLAGANFDLQALGELAVKYPNPSELERIINQTGGINNLDLDEDGNVDFINVTQYGDDSYVGLQFKAQLKDGESEIATIEYDKYSKKMNISGNNNYYAADAYYTRPFNPIGFYLFMGHPRYHSPYYYGSYGGYYSPYRSVGYGAYSSRSVVTTSRSTTTYKKATRPTTSKVTKPQITKKSQVASANATKKKEQIKKQSTKNGQKFGNQTKTQKQFQKRDANKPVNASGFSNKSKATQKKTSATKKAPAKKKKSYSSSKSKSSSSRKSYGSSSRSSSSRRSDITFKENIAELGDALTMIMDIDALTYTYKTNIEPNLPTTEQIGFSAQQLQDIVPQAVTSDELGLMVDYTTLVPVLTKALQQQQQLIDKLERRLIELEKAELASN